MINLLKKKLFVTFIFILSLSFALQSTASKKNHLVEEKSISTRLCIDPDWEPYEWVDDDGRFHGIAADLIDQIAVNADIDFELIYTQDWPESIQFAQEGRCDVLGFLNQTPERSQWLDFTDVYFTDPNVLITLQDFEYIRNLSGYERLTVALPHGTGVEQHVRRHYPSFNILNFDTELQALKAVRDSKADVAIRSLSVAAYLIRKHGLFDLKVSGELYEFSNEFRMGVVKENEPLVDRINQGIALLTPDDIRSAINRYVYIRFTTQTDYTLLFSFMAVTLFILGLFLYWTLKLKQFNIALQKNEEALKASRDKLQKSLDEEHMTNMQQHQFMRMVAHEFRTPLSVIESSCDLLELKTSNSPELSPTIDKQRLSVRYLSDLVDRALAEDRMVKTFWQRNAAWIKSEELLLSAKHYADLLNQGKHRIHIHFDSSELSGDQELLQMMLNNLIENAIKYSPKGGNITLEALQMGDEIQFSVEDEGIGIAVIDQPMVFGKYQRGQHENQPGLGLGLYLVKGIAKLHNGRVDLESTPNQGSKFIVTLPCRTQYNENNHERFSL